MVHNQAYAPSLVEHTTVYQKQVQFWFVIIANEMEQIKWNWRNRMGVNRYEEKLRRI